MSQRHVLLIVELPDAKADQLPKFDAAMIKAGWRKVQTMSNVWTASVATTNSLDPTVNHHLLSAKQAAGLITLRYSFMTSADASKAGAM